MHPPINFPIHNAEEGVDEPLSDNVPRMAPLDIVISQAVSPGTTRKRTASQAGLDSTRRHRPKLISGEITPPESPVLQVDPIELGLCSYEQSRQFIER